MNCYFNFNLFSAEVDQCASLFRPFANYWQRRRSFALSTDRHNLTSRNTIEQCRTATEPQRQRLWAEEGVTVRGFPLFGRLKLDQKQIIVWMPIHQTRQRTTATTVSVDQRVRPKYVCNNLVTSRSRSSISTPPS